MAELELREYLMRDGTSPFRDWFSILDASFATRVTIALGRIAAGHVSNLKGVGAGVLEYRMDFGPGYRIYLGRDGPSLVILLAGGTKRRQQRDIDAAHAYWRDYKDRKQHGEA